MKKALVFITILATSLNVFSQSLCAELLSRAPEIKHPEYAVTYQWLNESSEFARDTLPYLFQSNGAVRAASDKHYAYYWIRDGAFDYQAYLKANGRIAWDQFRRYIKLTQRNQAESKINDNFHAKYELSGTKIENWMKQGDGPGLRSLVQMEFAYSLMKEALTTQNPVLMNEVRTQLYDGKFGTTTTSTIKFDLESLGTKNQYGEIMANASNGEIWEEDWGRHLFNKSVSRSALLFGSVLARNDNIHDGSGNPGDPHASVYFMDLANEAGSEMEKHWDPVKKIFRVTLPHDPAHGEDPNQRKYKNSGLDSQVILASIEESINYLQFEEIFKSSKFLREDLRRLEALQDKFLEFGPTDPRMRSTYLNLKRKFAEIYPINSEAKANPLLQPLWGRYPEDMYGGEGNIKENGGNPWVLTTQGAAMFQILNGIIGARAGVFTTAADATDLDYFRDISPRLAQAVAKGELKAGQTIDRSNPLFNEIIAGLEKNALGYIEALRRHSYQKTLASGQTDPNYLRLNEQMDRNSGVMSSVENLGWNYAFQIELQDLLRQLQILR